MFNFIIKGKPRLLLYIILYRESGAGYHSKFDFFITLLRSQMLLKRVWLFCKKTSPDKSAQDFAQNPCHFRRMCV